MAIEAATTPPARAGSVTPAAKSGTGATAQLMSRVGRQVYTIPVAEVIEIMRVLPVEPIAVAPDYVRGLCIIRGEPVPVVDVGLLIGRQEAAAGRLVTVKAGALGLLKIREAGGVTIVQDEKSSVVYGMPRDAVHLGAAQQILALDQLAPHLAALQGITTEAYA
jgi:hypothetical protein